MIHMYQVTGKHWLVLILPVGPVSHLALGILKYHAVLLSRCIHPDLAHQADPHLQVNPTKQVKQAQAIAFINISEEKN